MTRRPREKARYPKSSGKASAFSRGVITLAASKTDPARQVGVFRPEAIAQLPAIRAAEMQKFRWIAGEWNHENRVPATRCNPACTDVGSHRFTFCERDAWICTAAAGGTKSRLITLDPFSHQWIDVVTEGSYGFLRSPHNMDKK